MREVNVGHKRIADYRSIVSRELMAEIEELAARLRGRRILHVNATAFGGGVAEILYTLVPLLTDVGLEAEWLVMAPPPRFFTITKAFHNALQGREFELTDEVKMAYETVCCADAADLRRDYDVLVVHDPQPLAIRHFVDLAEGSGAHWVWRCHLDTSTPDRGLSEYLTPFVNEYETAVFTLPEFALDGLTVPVCSIAPAIDPLAPKNMALSREDARYIVDQFGIDVDRPLLLQVSRFDPWKDPLGVVDVYRSVKKERDDVQLALVGSMASDDPEGWDYLEKISAYVEGDPDVFVLSNLDNVGSIEIDAFQSHADVVLQKSVREGFGLTVTEALWKARPTIAGAVGGIPLQIEDGKTGYLVDGVATCAERCLRVLAEPERHREMALRGKEHVRSHFLMPRLLRDHLRVYVDLIEGKTLGGA
ncbi:MAG TPA: glycosyltransferase [Thermoleophilia bacterium]|nr:glycosyltransferase [Thermoleophilia bacterium]HQJ98143.1 glycosyltransferase [Thermoleophilia bacterium]